MCGEYISQRIYKNVDLYNKYVDLFVNAARCTYKYCNLFVNTSTYLYIHRHTYTGRNLLLYKIKCCVDTSRLSEMNTASSASGRRIRVVKLPVINHTIILLCRKAN